MRLLDFPTLLITIASAIFLGYLGLSGHAVSIGDDSMMQKIGLIAGLSGIWQLVRQRFY